MDRNDLKNFRHAMGISQAEMSERAGIPLSTYRSIEAGAREMSGGLTMAHLTLFMERGTDLSASAVEWDGLVLLRLRLKSRLSQREVAAAFCPGSADPQIGSAIVRDWEYNRSVPKWATVVALAEAFGVSPLDFFTVNRAAA